MKVLFIGTPGVKREHAMRSLLKFAREQFPEQRLFIQDGNIPELEHQLYGDPVTFLNQPLRSQRDQWGKAFAKLCAEFKSSRTDHFFLSLHLVFHYKRTPIAPADFNALRRFAPDCIVTLIDDAYAVQRRIEKGGYKDFSLDELLMWRAEETMLGDLLARMIKPAAPPPHYVISVRHAAVNVLRLLLEPRRTVRLYLSYNITNTRSDDKKRSLIDGFRYRMYEHPDIFAFDPLTIDDLPPLYFRREKNATHFVYDVSRPEHRWPTMNLPERLGPLVTSDDMTAGGPFPISLTELDQAMTAMKAHVLTRDFRLIDQAHYIIVYRPTMNGEPMYSQGVAAEIGHAQATNCPMVIYVKKGEDPMPLSPLLPDSFKDNPNFIYSSDENELWKRIAEIGRLGARGRDHFLGT